MISLIIFLVNTANKLDRFRMNDIMWRYIKISNNAQNLEYLQSVERLYSVDPDKMKTLVEQEELHQKQVLESEMKNPVHNITDSISSLKKTRKVKSDIYKQK